MAHYTSWQLENCFKEDKELEWGEKKSFSSTNTFLSSLSKKWLIKEQS